MLEPYRPPFRALQFPSDLFRIDLGSDPYSPIYGVIRIRIRRGALTQTATQ